MQILKTTFSHFLISGVTRRYNQTYDTMRLRNLLESDQKLGHWQSQYINE